ncbi:urease accessory protein UreD [Streptomyces sp. AJS327]|uniref:urease accessory protein UreD n=1 Tax=Streptomyces sp. AJS327 TaxID=2545265 RepID=UPI0015DED281|nr:urease accessory protein UreD [Streptomyces sp. AJS327]MBA0052972.1 urease accessory protein UreD [Streptomyces sp. AJS327]
MTPTPPAPAAVAPAIPAAVAPTTRAAPAAPATSTSPASAPNREVTPIAPWATAGVRATARVVAARRGPVTSLPILDGDGPFELRRLRSRGDEARVCVVGAMSAPLGGDRLCVEATARRGAALHVTSAAATLALRGPTSEHATYDIRLTAEDDSELHWLPEPLICAAGSDLRQSWTVDLAPTARLLLREEQVLGRTGEPTGHVTTRLTVRRGSHTLLDQSADYGPGAPGWDGPAVLDGHRAVGQLLAVDPVYERYPANVRLLGGGPDEGHAAVTPLAGPGVLVTAVAPDGLRLRDLLDAAQTTLLQPPPPH